MPVAARRPALIVLSVLALVLAGAATAAIAVHLTAPAALAQDTDTTDTTTTDTDTTDTTTTDTTDAGGSGDGGDDGFPSWAWALIGAGIVLLLLLVFALGRRGRGGRGEPGGSSGASPTLSAQDRQARFGPALNAYQRDGWTVESRGADQAVLTRDRVRKRVWVDEYGELQEELLARQPAPFDDEPGEDE